MTDNSSATANGAVLLPPIRAAGLGWGLVGVVAFSFTMPFTRVAVAGLSPLFIGSARALVAALLAGVALAATHQRRPRGGQWLRLAAVGAGVVVGFPLLSSYALTSAPASHGAVVIALLPAATATMVVLRTRERPPVAFWLAAVAGAVAALGFASAQWGQFGRLHPADGLLFAAALAGAVGYAEGGLLARELGAWQTVSWALLLCAPLMAALAGVALSEGPLAATPAQWAAFGYLGVVSMYLGFFAWYRGLAIGPMAQVSQVQLVQPVLTILWAGLLLGEHLGWATLAGAAVVVLLAGIAVRIRSAPGRAAAPPVPEPELVPVR